MSHMGAVVPHTLCTIAPSEHSHPTEIPLIWTTQPSTSNHGRSTLSRHASQWAHFLGDKDSCHTRAQIEIEGSSTPTVCGFLW